MRVKKTEGRSQETEGELSRMLVNLVYELVRTDVVSGDNTTSSVFCLLSSDYCI